jgi:hypothetical protein
MWCELQSLPKTDFRWFVYPLLAANFDFAYNCSPISPINEQQLVLKARDVWNALHTADSTQTFDVNSNGIIPGILSGRLSLVWDPGKPQQVPSVGPITVNTGGAVPHAARRTITLHLPPRAIDATASVPAPGATSTGAKVAAGTAVVGGAAILGTVVFSLVKGQAVDAVLGHAWKHVKGWFR